MHLGTSMPAVAAGNTLDFEQVWAKGGLRIALTRRASDRWHGRATFHNYPIIFTVLQAMAGCASMAQGGDLYRRLDANGLVTHPASGASRLDFTLVGKTDVIWHNPTTAQDSARQRTTGCTGPEPE
ncbi:hypothetical protein T35B1_18338 [Salinisphaera shabanensis T35B1]|uniref:hypothetical protein n=1 Tax=Salinisphaera shabanensis TaxID=180542 RepID=UPI0033418C13